MNAAAQFILAYALNQTLMANAPVDPTLEEETICFVSVNSFALVMVVFSISHQFLCLADTVKQPDENLA